MGMPILDTADIAYLNDLRKLINSGKDPDIVIECPECGEVFEDPIAMDQFNQIHLIMRLHVHDRWGNEYDHTADLFTVVIGCEGYHILDASTGRERDHEL